MRVSLLSFLLLSAIGLPSAAFGDTLTTYTLMGTLQHGILSGIFTVTSSGGIINSNLELVDRGVVYQFGDQKVQVLDPTLTVFLADSAPNQDPDLLVLDFPGTTLVGYPGGPLCSVTFACQPRYPGDPTGLQSYVTIKSGYSDSPTFTSFSDTFVSLNASPLSAATPEPEALGLVGAGLAALAGAMQRRVRGRVRPGR